MNKSERTILIVGGSVAGLTLANMLEKYGIHYIVLEAHDEIAPQVGASIGLMANGLRILDQLGCADEIMSLVDKPIHDLYIRNPDGSLIKQYGGIYDGQIERQGYNTSFIDRQMLLKVLYNNLKSKASVLCGQRAVSVKILDDGVEVTTRNGDVYQGDVVIGADGIYSTVREEMWRIGHEISPGYFPADEWSTIPCYYKCIFGISHPIKALVDGVHYVYNHNFSYLILTGPGGRIYWFLFVELPIPLFGNDIPRFTKEDEAIVAQEHASDHITPAVQFGSIYEARTSSTLTPLHEHVFQKWHFDRIITIGDAAHKFHPIIAHGGNSAIETAATLVNHLLSRKNLDWTAQEIKCAFSATQNDRHDRVSWLVADSHRMQQMHAMATPLWAAIARILPLFISGDTNLHILGQTIIGASRLEGLPLVKREHAIPFDDELPEKPLPLGWLVTGLGVLTQGALYRLSKKLLLPLQAPTTFDGASLKDHYTGIEGVDKLLTILVSIFGGPVVGRNKAQLVQWVSFTPLLFSTILDWTLEAYRAGSKGLLTSIPSIFGTAYQVLGIGQISPLYHLVSVLEHAFSGFLGTVAGHPVTKEVADAVIPGLGLGYVLPTVLMMWPFENKDTWQKFVAFWQPFPIYVGLLVAGLSSLLRKQRATANGERLKTKQNQANRRLRKQDKPTQSTLRLIYKTGAATSALIHLWTVYRISSSSDLSFSAVFGKLGFLLSGNHASTPADDIRSFFQRDMLLNAASVLVHNVFRVLHLRGLGYITTKQAMTVSLATLVAQPVVGPAATHLAFLGWREDIFARVQRRMNVQS